MVDGPVVVDEPVDVTGMEELPYRIDELLDEYVLIPVPLEIRIELLELGVPLPFVGDDDAAEEIEDEAEELDGLETGDDVDSRDEDELCDSAGVDEVEDVDTERRAVLFDEDELVTSTLVVVFELHNPSISVIYLV